MMERKIVLFLFIFVALAFLLTDCRPDENQTVIPIETVIGEIQNVIATYSAGDRADHEVNGVTFHMRFVPPKKFFIATDDSDWSWVDHGYRMAETEVTYELWHAVYTWATANGYYFANSGCEGHDGVAGEPPSAAKNEPVTTINWRDTIVWLNALTEWYNHQKGTTLAPVYYIDSGYTNVLRDSRDYTFGATVDYTAGNFDAPFVKDAASGFRLPSFNEWELAARYIADNNDDGDIMDGGEYVPGNYASGAEYDYSNEPATDAVAWYNVNSGGTTHDVAQKKANALGLYDLSGNVWEWNFDWKTAMAARSGHGGSWFHPASGLQIGYADGGQPYFESNFAGFRFARTE